MNIVIIGAGFTGMELAKRLINEKNTVTLIDNDEETVRHASNRLDCTVLLSDGNSLETLEQAGIGRADALVTVTDSDEINMITCSLVDAVYPSVLKIARVRNYAYYLNNMILTAILAMSIVLVIIYSMGAELKYGTSTELLETAGDSVRVAVAGKLVPYTVLFTVLGVLLEVLLFGWCHYPLKGSLGWMILAVTALVLAYEAVAVFIVSLVPTLRLSISIGSLYSVLGITFAGFPLPLTSLPPALQGLSSIFPLRFYYQIYLREVIYGTGFPGWWMYLVFLLLFLFLPLLPSRRLYKAYKYQEYPKD